MTLPDIMTGEFLGVTVSLCSRDTTLAHVAQDTGHYHGNSRQNESSSHDTPVQILVMTSPVMDTTAVMTR